MSPRYKEIQIIHCHKRWIEVICMDGSEYKTTHKQNRQGQYLDITPICFDAVENRIIGAEEWDVEIPYKSINPTTHGHK